MLNYKIDPPAGAPSCLEEVFEYLPDTGEVIWKIHGNKNGALRGMVAGNIGKNGYRYIKYNGKMYLAHRLIWYLYYGIWPEYQIDHINGLRDDNRIANLRDVTHFMNHQNTKLTRNGKLIGTTYRGKGRWEATCSGTYLGRFSTEYEAHRAYLTYSQKYFPSPVEAWTPAPNEWVITHNVMCPNNQLTVRPYGSWSSDAIIDVARYVQSDGSLTDLRGGWDAITARTEVLG